MNSDAKNQRTDLKSGGVSAGRLISKMSDLLGYVSALAVLVMMILIVQHVVMRYVFDRPDIFTDIISAYLQVGIVFLGSAYTLKAGSHIRISMVPDRLPAGARRLVETITNILGCVFLGFFAWEGWVLVWTSLTTYQRDFTLLQTPIYLPQIVIPIGLTAFFLQFVVHTCQAFNRTVRSQESIDDGDE